ncbi:hypothetical protein ONZ45_g16314 [Pleurotus djamor]|nr:hypothetical protein ONZ45_g16314 [Pleurotus djamor]
MLMKQTEAQANRTERPQTGIAPGPPPIRAVSSDNPSASERDNILETPPEARHREFSEVMDVVMRGWAPAEDRLRAESKRANEAEGQRDELNRRVQVLAKEATAAKEVIQKLEKARAADKDARAEMDKRILEAGTELKALQTQLGSEKTRVEGLSNETNDLKVKLRRLEEARDVLEHDKAALQEALEKEKEERAECSRGEEARIQSAIQSAIQKLQEEHKRKIETLEEEVLEGAFAIFKQSFKRNSTSAASSKRKYEEHDSEDLLHPEDTEVAKRSKTS